MNRKDIFATALIGLATFSVAAYASNELASAPAAIKDMNVSAPKPLKKASKPKPGPNFSHPQALAPEASK